MNNPSRFSSLATLLAALLWLVSANAAQAATYYISPSGSDSNPGTSTAKPWQTLAKVSAINFAAGSRILLQGGQMFNGTLKLTSSGTAAAPILVGSYGTGNATIYADSSDGIYCYDNGGITLQNLNVTGPGAASGGGYGIELKADNANYSSIKIDHCVVSGFNYDGIHLGNYDVGYVYTGVTITSCTASSNGGHGLLISHANTLSISRCIGSGNGKYSGIDLTHCSGASVTNCTCYNNADIGIWCWDSDRVVIANCEVYGNGGGDGGFDLDVGTTNSLIKNCYAHDNGGAGYQVCSYNGNATTANNTIAYNIGENDQGGELQFDTDSNAATGISVYNNTFYSAGTQYSNYFGIYSVFGSVTNSVFANNILCNPSNSVPFYNGPAITWTMDHDDLQGAFLIWSNNVQYTSLSAFQAATGQEANSVNVLPGFKGTPGTKNARAYVLAVNSPVATSGTSIQSTYGQTPPTADYYGSLVPVNGPFSLGASQAAGIIANGNHTLTPQNALGSRLDAAAWGTANGTGVDLWSASGNGNQTWTFTNEGGNVYKIQPSYDLGLCLDVAYPSAVDLWADNGGSNQRWAAALVSGNIYTLAPLSAPGSCLNVYGGGTANGTAIDIGTGSGGSNQQWAIN